MGVLRPKQPFVTVDKKGRKHRFGVDTLVDEKDPIVKGREDLFESVDVAAERKPVTAHGPRVFDETEIAVAQVKRGRRNRPRRGQEPQQPADEQPPAETPEGDELSDEERAAPADEPARD